MGLIKENNRNTIIKRDVEPCTMNTDDCMFLDKDTGNCSAEWCIYKELPKMVRVNVKLNCEICKTNSTTVTVYSGETKYICKECLNKINSFITNTKCNICGTDTSESGKCICNSCASKIRRYFTWMEE